MKQRLFTTRAPTTCVIAERGSSFLPPGVRHQIPLLVLSDPRYRPSPALARRVGQSLDDPVVPITTGRDVAKILRLADLAQYLAASRWATPADSKRGDDVIIVSA